MCLVRLSGHRKKYGRTSLKAHQHGNDWTVPQHISSRNKTWQEWRWSHIFPQAQYSKVPSRSVLYTLLISSNSVIIPSKRIYFSISQYQSVLKCYFSCLLWESHICPSVLSNSDIKLIYLYLNFINMDQPSSAFQVLKHSFPFSASKLSQDSKSFEKNEKKNKQKTKIKPPNK